MIGVVVLSAIGIGIIGFFLARMIRTYCRLRAPHVVTCPATGCTAAISVDPLKASGLQGPPRLEVISCSRWPEREECHQACLRGFLESLGAKNRASLAQWYKGNHCALCGKRFGRVTKVWDLPAPLDNAGISHQWADVQDVAEMLPRSRPICWECQLAELVNRTPGTAACPVSPVDQNRKASTDVRLEEDR